MPKSLAEACAVWDPIDDVAYIFGGSFDKKIYEFNPVMKTFEFTGHEFPTDPTFCSAVWASEAHGIYILFSQHYLWSDSILYRFDPHCISQPITEVAVTGLPQR